MPGPDSANKFPAAESPASSPCDPILAEHVAEIRRLNKSALADFIEVGRRLSKCRALLKGEGRWRAWLKAEFAWDRKTASNFIHLFELSEFRGNVFSLPIYPFDHSTSSPRPQPLNPPATLCSILPPMART